MKKGLAIVTNGGGMKCAYSAGVLYTLARDYNLKDPEMLIGSSGSSGSLAYYLAGQYEDIKTIWTELLTSKKFVNIRRFWRIMDINYLIDGIFKKQVPLNSENVNNSETKLFIAATEYKTGQSYFFLNSPENNIFESLRASKAVPIAFNKKVNIRETAYIDGTISSPILVNIKKAISEGANNLIVICDYTDLSLFTKIYWRIYSIFVNKNIAKVLKNYLSQKKIRSEDFKSINMVIVRPSRKLKITPLDNKKEHLEEAFDLGVQDANNNRHLQSFLNSI